MKIVFDENVPLAMVRVFQLFQNEKQLQLLTRGLEILKAQDFYPQPGEPDYLRKNDAPWVRRFRAAGGKVIISGDTRMKTVPHERLALVEEKMVVFFFEPQWSKWQFCSKCSLLLHWWPAIIQKSRTARAPKFYHIPSSWSETAKLRSVSTKDQKLIKIERQKAVGDKVAAKRKVKREAIERQPELPFETAKNTGRRKPDKPGAG